MARPCRQNPVVRLLALILCLSGLPVVAQPLIGVPLAVSGDFVEYDKSGARVATNISAVICLPSGDCVGASDETRFLQRFTRQGNSLKTGGRLYLAPTKSTAKAERKDFDIEALALSGDTLIAVGSHSWARKKCKPRPRNRNVFVIEGRPARITARLSLQAGFARFPILARYDNRPLQQNGLNIEAATALNNTVYFGFRAPYVAADDQRVLILSVTLAALKRGDFSAATLTELRLNGRAGQGIRGMETLGNRILLLTGNAGAAGKGRGACAASSPHLDNPFSFYLWTPGADRAEFLATLKLPDRRWKAEGLLLLDPPTANSGAGIAVFFDGPANGAPHLYRLPLAQ